MAQGKTGRRLPPASLAAVTILTFLLWAYPSLTRYPRNIAFLLISIGSALAMTAFLLYNKESLPPRSRPLSTPRPRPRPQRPAPVISHGPRTGPPVYAGGEDDAPGAGASHGLLAPAFVDGQGHVIHGAGAPNGEPDRYMITPIFGWTPRYDLSEFVPAENLVRRPADERGLPDEQ
jgi:hypothetical protein